VIFDVIKARQSFSEIAALGEEAFSLDRAALTMALEEYPDIAIQEYLRRLDTLAARVEVLVGIDRSPLNVIESLNKVLFVQEGFRGNAEDYYDPRNSYINEVLDRKMGIPISLSVVYIEVARRINFPIEGVGFPGHFFIKHSTDEREILVDPFDLGRILTLNDCQELLDRLHEATVTMTPSLLQAMDKRAIITRMLYNLKGIYTQKEHYQRALSAIEKILMLNPGLTSEVRDRGLLYMQTSMFANAVSDLEYYLAHTAAPDDSAYIQGHVRILRRIVCCSN